jgi:uncharacterized protein YgbK (DUF1537 family)
VSRQRVALSEGDALVVVSALLQDAKAAGAPLPARTDATGPVLAVSDDRSRQTQRQMDAATAADWFVQPLELDASRAASQLDWVLSALRAGRSVGLTAPGDEPELAAIADAAAAIAAGAVAAGATRRLIVSGGEASIRMLRLLGVESVSIAAMPEDDVALLRSHAPDPAADGLELLLTDGRAGGDDLFVRVRGS